MLKKLWRKILFIVFPPLSKWTMRLILFTCRVEVKGLDQFLQEAASKPCILALWHNRIAPVSCWLEKWTPFSYTALTSKSRDGELIAKIAESYSRGHAIRVNHLARHEALKDVIKELQENKRVLVITPDGPRGPIYMVKPGIIKAAIDTKASIIPLNWTADRYWELASWDRFRIPKPFSTIEVTFGNPLQIPAGDPRPPAEWGPTIAHAIHLTPFFDMC